ncbi:MAG: TlpA disulfide reductase family protein [Planctomycetia bacterium]|nr:TlpA disulfide reductase family protein [Planctomycetia bacterium]
MTFLTRINHLVFVLLLTLALPVIAWGQQYTPEQILKVVPSQADVPCDVPTDAEIANCKIVQFKEGSYKGIGLVKPDGATPLRVWCAPEGSQKVEQIRYYRNGVEIFRDILGRECRWLNDAGSRWGVLESGTKRIASWKSLSPEEATAEIVAALKTNDVSRYKAVALTADDVKTLGVQDPLASELLRQIEGVDAGFDALVARLKLPSTIVWGAFNGSRPALLPADKNGLVADLAAYFNSSVVLMNPENAADSYQLFIGDLVRVGATWKIIGLPAGDEYGSGKNEASVTSVLFPSQSDMTVSPDAAGDYNSVAEQLNDAYRQLESATPENYAALCENAYNLLLTLAYKNPNEETTIVTQAADLVFTGIQSGLFPKGTEILAQLNDAYKDSSNSELVAHIRLRKIDGDFYSLTQQSPPPKIGDLEKAQTRHTEELAAFAEEFPNTVAGAHALMYLANDQEYLQEDDQAINYYSTVVKHFPDDPIGKKAQGALNRLQGEGKPFVVSPWNFLEGGTLNLNDYKGKETVIFIWASWQPDDVQKMQSLAKSRSINVVGVSLDATPDEATAFIKAFGSPLPWKNVCLEGGLDGPCALELGVQNVPMMILLDADANLVRANVMSVDDLSVLLGK